MGRFEFVLGIIFIVMAASVIRWTAARRGSRVGEAPATLPDAESVRLRDEVKQLGERIQVLERSPSRRETAFERQIEELRDR